MPAKQYDDTLWIYGITSPTAATTANATAAAASVDIITTAAAAAAAATCTGSVADAVCDYFLDIAVAEMGGDVGGCVRTPCGDIREVLIGYFKGANMVVAVCAHR